MIVGQDDGAAQIRAVHAIAGSPVRLQRCCGQPSRIRCSSADPHIPIPLDYRPSMFDAYMISFYQTRWRVVAVVKGDRHSPSNSHVPKILPATGTRLLQRELRVQCRIRTTDAPIFNMLSTSCVDRLPSRSACGHSGIIGGPLNAIASVVPASAGASPLRRRSASPSQMTSLCVSDSSTVRDVALPRPHVPSCLTRALLRAPTPKCLSCSYTGPAPPVRSSHAGHAHSRSSTPRFDNFSRCRLQSLANDGPGYDTSAIDAPTTYGQHSAFPVAIWTAHLYSASRPIISSIPKSFVPSEGRVLHARMTTRQDDCSSSCCPCH
ncbi:hypothetical protein DENSPDRAFT_452327 [Dentipellis sp. KUC8613]|nr:hypothetical protein DENSPDRAFT_452327 [Dentipellis sp. KUC8613]